MKKMLAQKIIQFLMNWLRSRFKRGMTGGKSKSGNLNRGRKLSPEYIHRLKISQIIKNGFRQNVWKKH